MWLGFLGLSCPVPSPTLSGSSLCFYCPIVLHLEPMFNNFSLKDAFSWKPGKLEVMLYTALSITPLLKVLWHSIKKGKETFNHHPKSLFTSNCPQFMKENRTKKKKKNLSKIWHFFCLYAHTHTIHTHRHHTRWPCEM